MTNQPANSDISGPNIAKTFDPGADFRELHRPGNPFVLVNVWDKGSAMLMAGLGAKALGTTSAGHAFTLGTKDMGYITRDQFMEHAESIVEATQLPVSGDCENGYGHNPEEMAETVKLAGEVGLAGISIEDTNLPGVAPYEMELAVERIRAAVAAARNLGRDFVLVARADGIMNGTYDIEEALRRLKAFEEAGADCLYAPLPKKFEDIERICTEIRKPVNALAAGPYVNYSVNDFAKANVARISLGSALAKVTHAAILEAGKEIIENGHFSPLEAGNHARGINRLINQGGRPSSSAFFKWKENQARKKPE